MKFLSTLISIVLSISISNAQTTDVDTIFTFQEVIGKIKTGTDTLISFIESEGVKDKISENVRIIDFTNNQYKITTYNIPVGSDDFTKVEAILDANDLHILSFYLKAKNDSALAKFSKEQIRGWLQIPQQEKMTINYTYNGNTFLSDGNTPWLVGLLDLKENSSIVIPIFHLFSNSLRWKLYTVLGEESLTIKDLTFNCWKVDAGPQGPPGFNAFHWYDKPSGQLLRVELSKEGESARYVSELENIH